MKTVRLIHWNEDEGLERQQQLEAFGFEVAYDAGDALYVSRQIRAGLPDAVVVDLSRAPSHGREIAHSVRARKSSRHVPIVFVDGEPDKVARTRELLPDAVFTTWGRIKTALPRAIAKPPANPIVPNHDIAWGRPLVDKLGMKPGFLVALLASPTGFADTLNPLPPRVTFTARPDSKADLFIGFARSARELQAHLLAVSAVADRQRMWLTWRKKASGVKSDIDANVVRHAGLAAGWVDFKVCSLDDTWSGLAFKKRK